MVDMECGKATDSGVMRNGTKGWERRKAIETGRTRQMREDMDEDANRAEQDD